jgi:hypothetical protein
MVPWGSPEPHRMSGIAVMEEEPMNQKHLFLLGLCALILILFLTVRTNIGTNVPSETNTAQTRSALNDSHQAKP